MLLGFQYLAVVLLVVFPVVGLVVRRKWRLAEARREEIRRLLVFASEEAAKVEREAISSYVAMPPIKKELQYQYQCALCFCHTTKLCARCKAVRYCSGKCQIIHWRQGHKDECIPFITIHKIYDAEGSSSQKAFKQEEYENADINFAAEGTQDAKPVEIFHEENSFSNSSQTKVQHKEDVTEVDCLGDGESSVDSSICISTDSDRSDGLLSTKIYPDKFETNATANQNKLQFSQHSTLADSVDSFSSSGKFEFTKLSRSDGDAQLASSSSSGWSIDGSKESSPPGPSTPSFDFWEGAIDSRKSRTESLDDSSESSCIDIVDVNLSNSRSSRTSSGLLKKALRPMDLQGSYVKTAKSDKAGPTTSGFKTPTDKDTSSKELSTDDKRINSLRPLNPQKSDHMVNDMRSSSHALRSCEVGFISKASDPHLPSISGRHSSGIPKTINNDVYAQVVKNGTKTSMWKVVDQLKASRLSRHPSGAGFEIAGKHNYKGLFSYELFIKLYNWKEVELRPCGLINCGNSCYANAVLQCLAFTPPLTAYFLQGLHSKECKKKEWCFTCELESLVLKAKEGKCPLSPIRILSHIQNIGGHLGKGREEDAHEFLRYAVDNMQSICLKEAGANLSGTLEEETTLTGLTFGGYLRSKIRCMKCGGKSERHERIMDLTVEIEGDIGTLEEALRKFTGTEILDGKNKYQCSRCKSYEKAKKKLTLLEAPNVLTIALKRFQSGKFGKINKSIQFPEILDLAPYMSGTSYKSTLYQLYGVVVHLDIMNAAFSGHYVCYVRNSQNKWYKIDDSTVKPVELERVLAQGAYMLLYARCLPRAPRSIRNPMVPLDPPKPENQASKPTSDSNYQLIIEEESLSDNSSSFFSEAGSCSTESSNRDSSSTEDYFDQIFGDVGRPWRNSPDFSDTSSSSSPLPLYSRSESNKCEPFLYSDISKLTSRNVVSSSSNSSCRETDSGRLGRVNPIDNISFRRSTRGRGD